MTPRRESLILDVDAGEGDAVAILLAIAEGLPLKAVITSYGYTTVERASYNAAAILELTPSEAEVWMGSSTPISIHPHFRDTPDRWENVGEVPGGDGLSGVSLPPPQRVLIRRFADSHRVDEIARRLREAAPVHYCVTGPCTNLALLCKHLGAEAAKVLSRITILAGSLASAGKPTPEFNAYCDPPALDTVLRSGVPIELITTDTTRHLTVPRRRAQDLRPDGPYAAVAKTLLNTLTGASVPSTERVFELKEAAALWLSYHEQGAFSPRSVAVDLTPQGYGIIRLAPTGTPVRVYMLSAQRSNQIIYDILQRLSLVDPV